jgi:hypothetical protein
MVGYRYDGVKLQTRTITDLRHFRIDPRHYPRRSRSRPTLVYRLRAQKSDGVRRVGIILGFRDGAGPSRVGFSAHWRSDNDNPALANFLKLLGERYPLPVDRA